MSFIGRRRRRLVSPAEVRLLGPNLFPSLMTSSRSQAAGAVSTYSDGVSWYEVPADTARLHGAERWLIMEPQRTNTIRNPRMEGAVVGVVGSGGSFPTNMTQTAAGLTAEVLAVTRTNGVDVLRLRLTGTASSTLWYFQYDGLTAIDAAPSSTWAASVFVREVAAPAPPTNYRQRIISRTSGGTAVTTHNLPTFAGPTTLTRVVDLQTLGSDGTIAKVTLGLGIVLVSGNTYDFTIEIGWPQMETPSVSTPILPPVGTPGASTRGLDLISADLSVLGVPASGRGLWLGSYVLDGVSTGTAQYMLNVDNNSSQRYSLIQNAANTNTVGSGTVAGNTINIKLATAGLREYFGISVDGAGNVSFALQGQLALRSLAGIPTSAFTKVRLANAAAGANLGAGRYPSLIYRPNPVSDADLNAAVAALAAAG